MQLDSLKWELFKWYSILSHQRAEVSDRSLLFVHSVYIGQFLAIAARRMRRSNRLPSPAGLCTQACGLPIGRYRYACPNSKFRAIGGCARPCTRTFDVCLLITIARVSPKAEPPLVDVRLRAATRRYRDVSRLGLKANQGESQRTLVLGESSRSCSLIPIKLRTAWHVSSSTISSLISPLRIR